MILMRALMMSLMVASLAGFAFTRGTRPSPAWSRRVAAHSIRAELSVNEQTPTDVDDAATKIKAVMEACDFPGWDERATWALEDSVSKFTLESGRIVLWRRISLEVPELLSFTPSELRARWLAQVGPAGAAQLRDEPPCLEDWVCIAPGRYEGAMHNLPSLRDGSLRATIEHDDGVAREDATLSDCNAEGLDGHRRWLRTRNGALFQLGTPRAAVADLAVTVDVDAGPVESAASFARSLVSGEPMNENAIDAVGEAAGGAVRAASGLVQPGMLVGGVFLAAAGAGLALFGHHVDVSVFIV